MKNFGLMVHFLLNPFFTLVVRYISSNIAKVGYIPVDLYQGWAAAIRKCKEYLKLGRAIVILQGRVTSTMPTPTPTWPVSVTDRQPWPITFTMRTGLMFQ